MAHGLKSGFFENRLIKALDVAFHAHAGQRRRVSGAPYFVHLLDVLKYLQMAGASEDVLIAGVLHDVVEDTSAGIDAVRPFGGDVLRMVLACSEDGNTPDSSDDEMKSSWDGRKHASLAKAPLASDDELLVMLADKISNLGSMRDDLAADLDVWSAFHADKKDLAWYYHSFWLVFADRFSDDHVLVKLYWKALKDVFSSFVNYWIHTGLPVASLWREVGVGDLEKFSSSVINNVSGVCFTRDGDVLVIRSVDEKAWVVPGGTPERGESFEDTLRRDLEEEASVRIGICLPIGVKEFFFRNNPTKERSDHFFQLVFVALIDEVLDPSPDPDLGSVRTRKFVHPDEFTDLVKWGVVSEGMILSARDALKKL